MSPTAPASAPAASRRAALLEELADLRRARNAVILAHYYQEGEIQDVADFVGDSLGLSQQAATTDAEVIVFAGVHFMAETAKILNPGKTVVVPDIDAGCSLDESAPAGPFAEWVAAHPGATVVTYINCSAAVKALSDIICTSSNAERVIRSVPEGTPILFAPDEHLGAWLQRRTGREMTLWPGRCMVHDAFAVEQLQRLLDQYPDASVVAHPECPAEILALADYVGSTTGLIDHVARNPGRVHIVATEAGLLHEIRRRAPEARVIPLPPSRSNVLGAATTASIPAPGEHVLPVEPEHGCACAVCPHMRRNTLEKLVACLRDLRPAIELDPEIARRALRPIRRMLEISA